QEEEESIKRAQARIEEDRQRKQAEENKERDRRGDEGQKAGRAPRNIGLSLLGATPISGIIFYHELQKKIAANTKNHQFNNNPGAPWTTELDQAAADNDDAAPKVMLGMTIGLLVTGTVVYLVGVHQRTNAVEDARAWHATILPVIGPQSAGLQLRWSF